MESKTVYFENPGIENTDEVLRIAKQRAGELGIKTIVVASSSGYTAVKAMEAFSGFKVIVVSHVTGFRGDNTQEFTEDNRKIVESKGGKILTTGHAFGGVSKAMKYSFQTYVIGDIIANTLYIFGQGLKVCIEIALMVADAGLVRTDEEVICIAGTGKSGGTDTAIVLSPMYSQKFFDMRVKEILCKPRF